MIPVSVWVCEVALHIHFGGWSMKALVSAAKTNLGPCSVFLGEPLRQIPPDAHHHPRLSPAELHVQRLHVNAHHHERGVQIR